MKAPKEKKEKVVFDPSVHNEELQRLIKDASANKLKAESFMDLAKDSAAKAKKLGIEPKRFGQLLALYHKGTRDRFEDENTEVVEIYDSIFK